MSSGAPFTILGMHRSGTSVATRIANLLGLYLGPADHLMISASETQGDWQKVWAKRTVGAGEIRADNPTGFWEHLPIVNLNCRILERFGGSTGAPPALAPGWQSSDLLAELQAEASRIIEEDFSGRSLWGWKDPRTCLTLGFWRRRLPQLRSIVCLRHPVDVTRSLQKRNDSSLARGVYLWLRYLRDPLATPADSRLVVFYDDLLAAPPDATAKIASFLGVPEKAHDPAVREAVSQFVDPALRHHASDAREPDLAESDAVNIALKVAIQIYDELKSGSASPDHARVIGGALAALEPIVGEELHVERQRWDSDITAKFSQISRAIPHGAIYLLVDDEQWGRNHLPGRRALPFIEKDGEYWGPPPNDSAAVAELDRMRKAGADFIVFAEPSQWWLSEYPGLERHLHENAHCVHRSEDFIVFDLRT